MNGDVEVAAAVRLQTHVWNPVGDRRALLLHGLCSDGACWWRLASELARDGWLVLAPDLRGHGRSPIADTFELSALTDDVALLGDGWDLVVGHSLGGAIAAALLARTVDVAAGVLLDPVFVLDDVGREALRAALGSEAGGLDVETVRAAHPSWDERDVWRKVLATRLVTPDVVDGVLDQNDPWDVVETARRWRQRIHLLVADPALGGLLDPALAARLADRPEVTYEVLEGAGHSLYRERPDAVSAAVRLVTA